MRRATRARISRHCRGPTGPRSGRSPAPPRSPHRRKANVAAGDPVARARAARQCGDVARRNPTEPLQNAERRSALGSRAAAGCRRRGVSGRKRAPAPPYATRPQQLLGRASGEHPRGRPAHRGGSQPLPPLAVALVLVRRKRRGPRRERRPPEHWQMLRCRSVPCDVQQRRSVRRVETPPGEIPRSQRMRRCRLERSRASAAALCMWERSAKSHAATGSRRLRSPSLGGLGAGGATWRRSAAGRRHRAVPRGEPSARRLHASGSIIRWSSWSWGRSIRLQVRRCALGSGCV